MIMKNKILMILLISAVMLYGCSNPFRKKNQCEILCEQMHSECNMSCPSAENFDPACHERCDSFRNCKDSCDKPLFKEGSDEDPGETGD